MLAVELRNVSFTYWQADQQALRDIQVQIPAGQFVMLTGPTGAGKSTFLQMLNGLIPHHIPGQLRGEVRVQGRDTAGLSVAELSRQVGLVFEDPDTQIVSLTVEDDVAFGPSNLGLPLEELRGRVQEALRQTRLLGLEHRNPFTLSGGEKQSLALAGVLAMQPAILALDEPTSMLDPLGRARIVAILKSLTASTHATILVAEQNPELVMELADRVLLFDGGRIVRDGTPQEVYSDVETVMRAGAKLPPVVEVFWELRQRGLWDGPAPLGLEAAAQALRPKLRAGAVPRKAPMAEAGLAPPGDEAIVEVRAVAHNYENEVGALKGISVEFRRGETTAIVGQNGSGKSTLALHLVGILQPTNPDGRVRVDGLGVRETPLRELIRHANYVFQNPDDQLFQETVAAEIEYGLKNLGLPPEECQARAAQAVAQFGLQPYVDLPPKALNRGLRTKTAIASVVAMRPAVLIVDEPTTGLDRREALEILKVFERLADLGTTVIFITHEMDLVMQFARRAVVMHAGVVLSEGPPAKIFSELPILQQASLSPPDICSLSLSLGWTDMAGLRTPADLADRIVDRM